MLDYYQVLGVPPDASHEAIRNRYRFLAQAYHPDKFFSDAHKQRAEEDFKAINEAYAVLGDSAKRSDYDLRRVRQVPNPGPNSTPPPKQRQNDIESNAWSWKYSIFAVFVAVFFLTGFFVITAYRNSRDLTPTAGSYSVESPAAHSRLKSGSFHVALESVRTFKLWELKGESVTYESGIAKKREQVSNSFKNGALTFAITGPGKGILIGNVGTSDVEVQLTDSTVSFVEMTNGGEKHTLVISAEWDWDRNGFRCSYTRNVWIVPPDIALSAGMPSVKTVSHFNGIARPFD